MFSSIKTIHEKLLSGIWYHKFNIKSNFGGKQMKTNILEPYQVIREKIKDYGPFILYQVLGIRGKEKKKLYKICEWKTEDDIWQGKNG